VPSRPSDPERYLAFVDRLRGSGEGPLGEPRFDDDDWEAKLELFATERPPVVSFTFGCPSSDVLARLRRSGSEGWVTVTSPDEASEAARAGADALVVQGSEAGGHRASFVDRPDLPLYGLLSLLQLVRARVDLPLVASGGIATGSGLAGALAAGATAGQLGTAFMRCPEAGTARVLREALATPGPTALTRAFTGRLARGIRNRFMDEHDDHAPIAYPEVHHLTAPLRREGRERGDLDLVNLWAGEAHELAQERAAAQIVRELAAALPRR
jgi:nitronate monooxygenase